MEAASLLSLLPLVLLLLIVWLVARRYSKRAAVAAPGPGGLVPYGVQGWLAFFVFASAFLSPLFAISRMGTTFIDAESKWPALVQLEGWSSYKVVSWLVVIAVVLWQCWVAFRLNSRLVPSSARNAKILLATAPFLVAGTDAIAGKFLLGVDVGEASAISFVKGLFVSGVWFLYFARSKRVRNTYYAQTALVPVQTSTPLASLQVVPSELVVPPPADDNEPLSKSFEDRLDGLKRLLDRGLISPEDYERKKTEILDAL